ncbi:MAG TPA: ABC transporter ATP-binding protein [Streptosporangiaceae bacterium]|nr:ABC transporter ATP-binding protein [Streptosporangiaceae bacterium]
MSSTAAGTPAAKTSASLQVRDVSAGYGAVQVLRGVSVTARAGTITAVLGANGAGKTTLLRTIDGSLKPTQGQISLDGTDLTGKRPEDVSRAGVAHVPEGQGVITELTVAENLQLGLLLRNRGERAAAQSGLYDQFKILADRRNKPAGTLSGGERQMLVIARALATNPSVLLLDEPSLGLAPKIVRDVLDLISRLKQDSGLTIILVEQNARSALAIADTGVVLNLGAVVATAPAGQLAADEALRRHYLGF